jgi:hypothetical protein
MKHLNILLIFLMIGCTVAQARQKKELDFDIVYDESKVSAYQLPELLISADGDTIDTPDEWTTKRRPEILSLFANLIYGRIPHSSNPMLTDVKIENVDVNFMNGKATRKNVRLLLRNINGRAEMNILIFTPNGADSPVPAFMLLNFDDNASAKLDINPNDPTKLKSGLPLAEMLDRGYAFISVYQQDLIAHNEVDFDRGIQPLFFQHGQSFPKAHEWGVLATIGWGAMRALDYLETDKKIDQTRVALMGHSKLGKATLWVAAQDERFALAISAQSGCAGAALWRRRSGETLEKMVTRFPYWLCRNAWKFVNQEDDLPVDQHMLLALMAPRPVYVASGEKDGWADPRGEYLSAYHASEAYRLLGKTGLVSEKQPPLGEAVIKSDVGYHVRKGGHSIEKYDWEQFLNFADYHLKK